MYKHCPIITATAGFVVLVVGVICTWYAFPALIQSEVQKSIALKEGTTAYDAWKKQPFPLLFKIFIFNVTNPDGVMVGEKPIVKEVGPYIYSEYIERINREANEEDDTIRYFMQKTFFFNQKLSGCRTEEDIVTVINAALMGTVLQVQILLPAAVPMITEAYPFIFPGTTDMFLRISVGDLLFKGLTMHCTAPEIDFLCGAMRGFLPQTIKVAENGKDFEFSMFGYMNVTPVGPYVMERGMKENSTRGELVSFMDGEQLDVWLEEGRCNMINGSDTGLYFPMQKPVDKIYTFTSDVCRSVFVAFEKKVEVKGLKAFKYSAVPDSLGQTKENMCFCSEGEDAGDYVCPPNGLVDLTPCLKAPVMMSFPHFYLADKSLVDFVVGLKPVKDKHESFMIIEPISATPLGGSKRAQMSILLKKVEEFPLLANVSEGIFPILWLDEAVDIPDDFMDFIKSNFKKMGMLDILKWTMIIIGIGLMLLSFVLVMYQEKLMCFEESGKVSVSSTNLVQELNHGVDIQFNNTMVYPGLYPQLENRNVSESLKKPQHVQEAWQFKM